MELSKLDLEDKQNFELIENDEQEQSAEKRNAQVRCWVGTWNNPSMSDDEFEKFFLDLYNSNLLEYAIFQREKGEECGTIHFQFFVNFKNARYFTWVKKTLPYGCHFKPMISTKTRCRAYCSKPDTRVNPPREIGEFVEERARTDLLKALKMQDEGVPLEVIESVFPTQVFMYRNQFVQRAKDKAFNDYKKRCRNLEVTYIYGEPGVGKTSGVLEEIGLADVFTINSEYGQFMFDGYDGENVVVFDEFVGQVKPITRMNQILQSYPLKLNIKGGHVQAQFEKVYILANIAFKDIYKEVKKESILLYEAFLRRIHKVMRLTRTGELVIERETIFEDIPKEEQKLPGLTKRVSKVIDYKNGNAIVTYDRHPKEIVLTPIKEEDMPFKEKTENIQEILKF